MKILALMPDAYNGFGGIAQYNRDLLDTLVALERVDRIVSLARHYPDADSGLEPPPKKLAEYFFAGSSVGYALAALRYALRLKPDVILCGHINLLPVAALVKKFTRGSLILELFGLEAWERRRGLRSWGLRQASLVIAISRFTRARFIRWSGLDRHRIKIVPNAVHLDRYSSGEKPRYLIDRYGVEGKRVLLTVGRLPSYERYKGQDRIIALLPRLTARLPNLVYVIAGDGSDRPRLEAMVSTLGLEEHVVFAGRIREDEKIDHYNLADAFAMPSTSEGFGFVFLEAAACGVPVLGGKNDGSRDALVDGHLGVMVDAESPSELLVGLEEVLKREKGVPDCIKPFGFPRFQKQIEELVGSQRSEVRSQRSEVRDQKSEVEDL